MLETSTVFGNYTCGIQFNDPYSGLFKRNNTFILQFTSGGSSGRQQFDYIFRFINNDFYLVESDYSEYELPLDGNGHFINIYYLKSLEEDYDIGEGKTKDHGIKQLKKVPLIKLKEFVSEIVC